MNAQHFKRILYSLYSRNSHIPQAGVQDSRVLPFKQPHAPILVRKAHPHFRSFFSNESSSLVFVRRVHRRKHTANRYRPRPVPSNVPHCFSDAFTVKRRNLAPVKLIAASDHVCEPANRVLQRLRPVNHRRQQLSGGQRQSYHGGGRQAPLFQQGVREVGRAHHDSIDIRAVKALLQQFGNRVHDAGSNILCRGHFGGCREFLPVHQHSVGIGSAYIHAHKHIVCLKLSKGCNPSRTRTPSDPPLPGLPRSSTIREQENPE